MSLYRKVIWGIKGYKEYTNSGYEKASIDFDNNDLFVNLSNKAIMITGCNSGIGKVTALELAKRGATIYMVCRDKVKAESAQREIKYLSGNERIYLFIVDLSLPRQVHLFAKKFLKSNSKLDILVNNAGCMINTLEYVENGMEKNFATNTLSVYILTKSLLPLLKSSTNPRVIIVTSGGMLVQKLKPVDFVSYSYEKFDGAMVYAQNKRQQVVMSEIFAKLYPMVFFATMHPGWADTPAVQTSLPEFRKKFLNKLRTPEQGADTLIWMCCYRDLELFENSSFFQDRKSVSKHLPLAHTKNTLEEEIEFYNLLERLFYFYKV